MMESKIAKTEIMFSIAGPEDLPKIYSLVDRYDDGLDICKDNVKVSLREFVYAKGVFLIKREDKIIGGLAGYVAQSMFHDEMIFNVMFFYILPEFRKYTKRIMLEMELILLTTKANQIVYGIPANANMSNLYRFFRIMGYKPLEMHVTRRLSNGKKVKTNTKTN